MDRVMKKAKVRDLRDRFSEFAALRRKIFGCK